MRALVTGASGFTGSHLAARLLGQGATVVGLDLRAGADEACRAGMELHLGSVTDATLVDRLVRGCDEVYHLAAAFRQVNLPRRTYREVNVEGTRVVMAAALRYGARALHCSTCGVHGDVERPPADEDSAIRPADYYQSTKWEGEEVAREHAARGLWVTIVRPTAIYGPGDRGRFAMLFRRVAAGRFPLLGDGSTHYHPVYVGDVVTGMQLAIRTEAARGRAYLLAGRRSVPLRELITGVGTAMGIRARFVRAPFWPVYAIAAACELLYRPFRVEPPLFRRRVDWYRQNRSFDIGRARRELGFEPAVDLAEGLALTADWHRRQGAAAMTA